MNWIKRYILNPSILFALSIVFFFTSIMLYNYEIYTKEIAVVFNLTKNNREVKNVNLIYENNPFRIVGMFNYKHGKYRDVPIRVIIDKPGEKILNRTYYPSHFGVGGTRIGKNIITFYNYGKFKIPESGAYKIDVSIMSRVSNFNEFRININESSGSGYVFFHFLSIIFLTISIVNRKTVFIEGIMRLIPYMFLLLIGMFPLLL